VEVALWRWPESNRLRQRLQGAPATLAVTPAGRLRLICHGLPFVWCSGYGHVNYQACTRGFAGGLIRLRVNENRPVGIFPGRLPASACSRLPGNHCPGQGSQKPRRRVHVPESLRRLARGHISRVGRPPRRGNRIFWRIPRPGARPGWVDVPLVRLEPDRCAIDLLGTRGRQGAEGSWWRGCRPHAVGTQVSLAPRRGVAGAEADPVTLAPPVPKHTAWMSHSCSWSDMAGTSTPYQRSWTGRRAGFMGHGSTPGTQEHQGWAGAGGGQRAGYRQGAGPGPGRSWVVGARARRR
jgi:hypothetical protein